MAPLRTSFSTIKREQERQRQEREWLRSLPLSIRKAIKERNAALGACGTVIVEVRDNWTPENRERYSVLRQNYETLRAQVDQMIKEHKGA